MKFLNRHNYGRPILERTQEFAGRQKYFKEATFEIDCTGINGGAENKNRTAKSVNILNWPPRPQKFARCQPSVVQVNVHSIHFSII